MTPLGWADPGASPHPAGPACLICADTTLSPRERMRQQAQFARADFAFLPLVPTSAATVEQCRSWAEDQASTLTNWLSKMRGLAQFTLAFTAPAAAPSPDGWLRARAAQHQHRTDNLTAVQNAADALLAPLNAHDWRLRDTRGGPMMDALAPADQAPGHAISALRRAGVALTGWSLNLVGPLPAYGFAPESAPN
ncbi:MAG: hypothetical protein AAGA87_06610 [Pseudomonadota bacterium]